MTFRVQKRPVRVNEKYKRAAIRGQKMRVNEYIHDSICLIVAGGRSSSGLRIAATSRRRKVSSYLPIKLLYGISTSGCHRYCPSSGIAVLLPCARIIGRRATYRYALPGLDEFIKSCWLEAGAPGGNQCSRCHG